MGGIQTGEEVTQGVFTEGMNPLDEGSHGQTQGEKDAAECVVGPFDVRAGGVVAGDGSVCGG